MNIKFVVNDYMLIWNLLFGPSITESVYNLKQKLWMNYRRQYQKIEKDKEFILLEKKNFIPDDDTIYNLFLEAEPYQKIKKDTEKYRIQVLKIWDEKKKETSKILKELLRFDIKSYQVMLVHPALDVLEYKKDNDKEVNTLILGSRKEIDDPDRFLSRLVASIVKQEIGSYQKEYKEIVQAVIELAIENEFYTRISKGNHSFLEMGDPTLRYLKRQIYPYWLMYLGADKEEMVSYMMRDKIAFDIDKYVIEKQLKKVNLYSFIDFCIKNQKYIVKINELEIN